MGTKVPSFLEQRPDETVADQAYEKIVGGPVTENLEFKVVKAGRGRPEVVVKSAGHPDKQLVRTTVISLCDPP